MRACTNRACSMFNMQLDIPKDVTECISCEKKLPKGYDVDDWLGGLFGSRFGG